MSIPERYKWPPRMMMRFFGRGLAPARSRRDRPSLDEDTASFTSRDRELDLVDYIFASDWPFDQRTFEIEIVSRSKRWISWNEKELGRVEEIIKADFNYDGYRVKILQISGMGEPCSTPMRWRVVAKLRK